MLVGVCRVLSVNRVSSCLSERYWTSVCDFLGVVSDGMMSVSYPGGKWNSIWGGSEVERTHAIGRCHETSQPYERVVRCCLMEV